MAAPARVLVAKPGLDGHDRGAKLVARALRDAGFEVIYTGIRQTPEMISAVAVQEDVDIVGLSILSGSHIAVARKTIDALTDRGAGDVRVVVGGTIPHSDIQRLVDMGVCAVFPTDTPMEKLVADVRRIAGELPADPVHGVGSPD